MPVDAHKNFAVAAVATAPTPADSGTSLVVGTGEGAAFSATPFNATVWPADASPTSANAEIVRVTNITGDTLTITRAQEGSSARSIIVGDRIGQTITAKTLTDIETSLVKVIPFTILGNAAVQTYAPRKYFPEAGTLKKITISCGTAPSGGNLVLQLKKNNSNFGATLGVTSGAYTATATYNDAITANDYLQVSFSSVGSPAAANVVIELEVL